jgi:hypothetical protein
MAPYQIEHQVVPGHGRARGDQFLPLAGDDQHPLGMDRNLRIGVRESLRVDVVDGRVRAVEQLCLREKENTRTGRAQKRAATMHGTKPVDQFRMPALPPTLRSEQDRGHDDDGDR